jgi:hypothetical protein
MVGVSIVTITAQTDIQLTPRIGYCPQTSHNYALPILESRKCLDDESGSAVSFSFRGSVTDHKFEGPGKFKQGVIDSNPDLYEVCANIGKIIGDR